MSGKITGYGRTPFGPDWPGQRCGAKTKRSGKPCLSPAVKGKNRCRMHGGKSTGPKTAEGKARIAAARTKHGLFSKAGLEARRVLAEAKRKERELKKAKRLDRKALDPAIQRDMRDLSRITF